MARQSGFRLTVLGMMFGIAVLALLFVWIRFSPAVLPWNETNCSIISWSGKTVQIYFPDAVAVLGLACALPFLMFLTLVVLGWGMLPPRPRLRQLRRRPGFLLVAVIVGCFISVPACAAFDRVDAPLSQAVHRYFLVFNSHIGWALLGGCLALAYIGRARPHRSRFDRLGIVLAGCWLAAFVAYQITWLAAVTR